MKDYLTSHPLFGVERQTEDSWSASHRLFGVERQTEDSWSAQVTWADKKLADDSELLQNSPGCSGSMFVTSPGKTTCRRNPLTVLSAHARQAKARPRYSQLGCWTENNERMFGMWPGKRDLLTQPHSPLCTRTSGKNQTSVLATGLDKTRSGTV
jgi:hypothetical protein